MKIVNLKLNGIVNPVGFLYEKLLCSWKVTETEAKTQKWAKIEVSKDASFAEAVVAAEGDLASNETEIHVDLEPYTTYYWRVSVEGDNGEKAVSEAATFETAKLSESFLGKWIACEAEDTYHPVFAKSIKAGKAVKRARLYMTGLGLFEAYANGKKIGNEFLAPYLNDYEVCFQYFTYDITEAFKDGEAKLEVMLGEGWYMGLFGLSLTDKNFGDRMCMIADIRLEYEDGSVEVIGTDETWTYRRSDIEKSGIYFGEVFNRLLNADCDNAPKQAVVIDAPKHGKLSARYSLPVIIKETIAAKEIIKTPAGETVIDFGQNHAGIMSFEVKGWEKGAKVTFETAEILQNGNFFHDNYRDAESLFTYISDGRDELVRPHFTFYGYRYLKVTGWPGELKLSDVTANVLYSDMEITGHIETSNAKINRLFENCMWGQKSNFIDVPTDCPQRSERLGWTGDAQVFTPTASFNMDTRAFYHKFYKDLKSDQDRNNGAISSYIPSMGTFAMLGSSIWADVGTMSPDAVYTAFGNLKEMALYYPMMKDWVEWMYRKDEQEEGGARACLGRGTFGDWLGLDGVTDQSMKGGTSDDLLNHAYYYWSTKITGEMAERLGYTEDAAKYALLAGEIKQAFLNEYLTPNGLFAKDTQASYIIALKFGLYNNRERMVAQFFERLKKDNFEIRCGFAGAPLLCLSLCENGLEELAYHFLFKENFPSWLYCVNLGATTIWERWNSLLPDGICSGTGMNSFNHYSYGSVVEFMYKYIGGLRAAEPGFRKAIIAPKPSIHFTSFKSSYDSACGKYVSEWAIAKDGTFKLHVEVPFNCKAEVTLPRYAGEAVQELEAGSYDFEYMPTEDLRGLYGMGTRLIELAEDEAAVKILQEKLPIAFGMLMERNPEFINASFADLREMFFFGFVPEQVDACVQALSEINCWGKYDC